MNTQETPIDPADRIAQEEEGEIARIAEDRRVEADAMGLKKGTLSPEGVIKEESEIPPQNELPKAE